MGRTANSYDTQKARITQITQSKSILLNSVKICVTRVFCMQKNTIVQKELW
ncbi:hypothetical protein Barb4_01880 [Bacteroidales bacterium Barb4]|nr:hypothetical protein Barb4_01880 [Bacteroidales bacterium Barb4]